MSSSQLLALVLEKISRQSSRIAIVLIVVGVWNAPLEAQKRDLSQRLREKTTVKIGGIYRVGTDIWTRAGALGALQVVRVQPNERKP